MIQNYDQLLRTQQQCVDFQRTIDETVRRLEKEPLTSEMIARAIAPLQSYLLGLQEEVAAYEQANPPLRSIDDFLDSGEGKSELDAHCQAVATRIRTAREAVLITQEELANRSQIPLEMIQRIELGQHSPTAKAVTRLAFALNIAPGLLMDGI